MAEQGPKRPHVLLRALLTFWLVVWIILLIFFLRAQFAPQPIFSWPWATVWLSVSVLGWLAVFRLLLKLGKAPPE